MGEMEEKRVENVDGEATSGHVRQRVYAHLT